MTQAQIQSAIILKEQSLTRARIRVEVVQGELSNLWAKYKMTVGGQLPEKRVVSNELILETCCAVFRVSAEDVLSKSRRDEFVQARQACMFIIRSYADQSYEKIGKFFGRDHSTVLHNVTTFQYRIKQNDRIRERYERCLTLLKTQPKSMSV